MTVHVDPCPTCHGTGGNRVFDGTDYALHGRCPACPIVPGYQVPEWVVVPTVAVPTYRGPAAGNIVITETEPEPDPRYVPGASVTLTATCPGPAHDGIGGEYYCDRGCNTGKVPVGSAVIADLVPVVAVPDTGYPDGAPDLFAYVSKAGALRIVDRIAKTDTFIAVTPPRCNYGTMHGDDISVGVGMMSTGGECGIPECWHEPCRATPQVGDSVTRHAALARLETP